MARLGMLLEKTSGHNSRHVCSFDAGADRRRWNNCRGFGTRRGGWFGRTVADYRRNGWTHGLGDLHRCRRRNGGGRKERGTATRIKEHCLSAMRGGLAAIRKRII